MVFKHTRLVVSNIFYFSIIIIYMGYSFLLTFIFFRGVWNHQPDTPWTGKKGFYLPHVFFVFIRVVSAEMTRIWRVFLQDAIACWLVFATGSTMITGVSWSSNSKRRCVCPTKNIVLGLCFAKYARAWFLHVLRRPWMGTFLSNCLLQMGLV